MDQQQWQPSPEHPARAARAYNGQATPEILPPGSLPDESYGYQQQRMGPPRPRKQRPGWMISPATYLLVAINIAVFVLMIFRGVSATAPNSLNLVHWGANFGLAVLLYGQWWRLVTATFVHAGVIHLATNMWCLWNLGLVGEPLLGTFGLLATYLLTGVMGNLLSVAVNPSVVGVGASGAVFGLAGVLILLLGSPLLPVDRAEVKRLRRSVIYFAVLNFVIGIGTDVFHTSVQIDNMAHLGGFLCGLALGVPLVPRIGAPRSLWVRRQWIAFGGMLLLVLLGARFVASLRHG